MSLRRALVGLLLLVPFSAGTAQTRAGSCDLHRRVWDNPISDHGGWSMDRWKWHAFYPALSSVTAVAIHRTTRLPGWASAVAATLVVGVLPHVRGVVRGAYRVDAGDWAFDAFTRAAPAIYLFGRSGKSWQATTLAVTTYGLGYLALCPFASP